MCYIYPTHWYLTIHLVQIVQSEGINEYFVKYLQLELCYRQKIHQYFFLARLCKGHELDWD